MNKFLQVYGKNAGAQEIVQTELTNAFPSLVEQFDMVNRIYEKFYDWLFPFVYTEDGGADMTWRANVRSWLAKNPKLAELEAHFAQGTLSGTLTEKIDDTDNATFTDNRATKQSTTFKGVDTTGSGALADSVTNEFETGKNTTNDNRKYNRTRTYADGRNWVQVMQDVQKAEAPVYTFINSFARLLVSPAWCKQDFCEVLPPSVEMSTKTVSVPAGSEPTAEIVNRGTPFNADWLLSLGIPQGTQGDTGTPALTYNNMYFSNVVPSESMQIIQEVGKFNRVPLVGDMCNFIVYYTGESPNTRPVYIVIGRCTVVDASFATFETANFAVIGGENGTDGQDGAPGVAALEISPSFTPPSAPVTGNTFTVNAQFFNRTPSTGEGCFATFHYGGNAYSVSFYISAVESPDYICTYENVVQLTAKKYVHYIFLHADYLTTTIFLALTFISSRQTSYTFSDLISEMRLSGVFYISACGYVGNAPVLLVEVTSTDTLSITTPAQSAGTKAGTKSYDITNSYIVSFSDVVF